MTFARDININKDKKAEASFNFSLFMLPENVRNDRNKSASFVCPVVEESHCSNTDDGNY